MTMRKFPAEQQTCEERCDPAGERGATLVFFAFLLVILMVAAAIGVDMSSASRRGQEMQNLADAAALSAVTTFVDTGNQVLAVQAGTDAVEVSGVPDSDTLAVSFSFIGSDTAEVTVVDDDPPNFFSAFVQPVSEIKRTATAQLDSCALSCAAQGIAIDAPFDAIQAQGSGDGFIPIPLQGRFYALNHNNASLVCVDRYPDPPGPPEPCWGPGNPRQPFPSGDTFTDTIFYTAVVGDRIWYGGQENDRYSLFCWETRPDVNNDGRCTFSVPLANLEAATFATDHFRSRGGALSQIGDEIFVFTDNHQVHCVNGITGTACGGYGSPKASAMAGILPPLDPDEEVSGAGMDRLIHDDGRIYVSLNVMPGAESQGFDSGTWVHCWDTNKDNACDDYGFTPYKIHNGSQAHPRWSGRLFFFRSNSGAISGVCSTTPGDIVCIDEDTGAFDAGQTAALATLEAAMPNTPANSAGVHTYHEPSNRLFLTSPRAHNTVSCWNFTLSTACAQTMFTVLSNQVQAYGFVYEGDCLYGLGHTTIFFTMDPDGNPGCRSGFATQRIDPCICADGSRYWGTVEIDDPPTISGPFEKFSVTVVEEDNGPVLVPTISMIDHPDGKIPLDTIPSTVNYVTIIIEVVAKIGEDPFGTGQVPAINVTWIDKPVLTE